MQGVLIPLKTQVSTRDKQSQSRESKDIITSKTGALLSSLSYSSIPSTTATISQPVGTHIGPTDSFACAGNVRSRPTSKQQPLRAGAGKKRFAPKTRTGCLTCRARRVKCDETKPSCARCVKGKYKCQYAPNLAHEFKLVKLMTYDENGAASYVEAAKESVSEDVRMLQPVTPSYGSSEECYYLNRFLCLAAPWFSQYIDPTFFYKLVPQRSWGSPALKHSVVALALAVEEARFGTNGAENPMFSFGYEKWDRRRHKARHHWHYSQALEHVYREPGIAEDVVLLASALFWLHDNVTRHSATAMVHLQGFLRIITERRLRREKDGVNWWRERENDWETVILRSLVFSADVADDAFAATIEPDLMKSIRSRMSDSRYSRSFKSMATIRDELRLGLTAIPYSVRQVLEELDGGLDANRAVSTTELRTYFEQWYTAFSNVPDAHPVDLILLECHYICVILRLQIHECGEGLKMADDPQSVQRMEYILSMLETVDFKAVVQPPLGTDVELAVIPILTQLIVLSSSVDIRRRSFHILKNLHRVEGLWSSDVVFDMMSIAYPLSGRDGPWKRDVLKPARLSPLTATDDTMIAIRDGRDIVDEPAFQAANLNHQDGIVRLPDTNGPGGLAKAPSAEGNLADKLKDLVRAKSTSIRTTFLPKQNAASSKPNTLHY